jgi:hypothetical protein
MGAMERAMTALLQTFIEALRNELQQFGEMLALLDQHHQLAQQPRGDETQASAAVIHAQRAIMQRAREQRQAGQRRLACGLNQPECATFAQLLPLLPTAYQPLLTALVQENHELLQRIEQRAQHNQGLLQRSLDRMRDLIDTLPPAASLSSASPVPCPPPSELSGSLVPDAFVQPVEPRSTC